MLRNLTGKMAAQRSLFEFYSSDENPSQDDLANSKRKKFDEDIIPSDFDSERTEEELEEEIDQQSTDSEVEEHTSIDEYAHGNAVYTEFT